MPVSPRLRQLSAFGAFLLVPLLTTAAQAGSAEEGQAIARRWCSSCHDIGSGEKPSVSDAVPTFDFVARRKDLSRAQLEAWIGNPHPPMPNLSLTRNEIDNLVAYIESLRTPK